MVAGRWIAIRPTSRAYAAVAADVTFGSFVKFLMPRHRLSLVGGTFRGMKVRGVRGTLAEQGAAVTETTYAARNGSWLPIELKAVAHGPHGGRQRMIMSRWNEPVRVAAPAHALSA